jgi:uncharacterized protein YndB with AHSA1/START domain
MAVANPSILDSAGRELVLTRTFDAPRRLVFEAWTDPRHTVLWWGPKGFTNPVCEMDVRPGGTIRIVMRAPADAPAQVRGDHPMTGVFHEIVKPERLVFTSAVDDADGNRVLEVLNTVTFIEHGGKTTLTLRARIVKATAQAAEMLAGMEAGWSQSLERLVALVARIAP